ncbi:MAG: hypothetical protein C0392_11285 [Syntrophus sp. (in: bacteria)]|nr:hypothetical protein [Syntrophus sp. (in: bacteria)]
MTNAPEPSDIPSRASAGLWLTRRNIDLFVDACAGDCEEARGEVRTLLPLHLKLPCQVVGPSTLLHWFFFLSG